MNPLHVIHYRNNNSNKIKTEEWLYFETTHTANMCKAACFACEIEHREIKIRSVMSRMSNTKDCFPLVTFNVFVM